MDWLQKVLENAVYGADGKLDIAATMGKVNAEAAKHIVPKEQYNSKVSELEMANNTIKDLKKNNGDNEELQKTIKTHEGTIKQLQKDHDITLASLDQIDKIITGVELSDAIYEKFVMAGIDFE